MYLINKSIRFRHCLVCWAFVKNPSAFSRTFHWFDPFLPTQVCCSKALFRPDFFTTEPFSLFYTSEVKWYDIRRQDTSGSSFSKVPTEFWLEVWEHFATKLGRKMNQITHMSHPKLVISNSFSLPPNQNRVGQYQDCLYTETRHRKGIIQGEQLLTDRMRQNKGTLQNW